MGGRGPSTGTVTAAQALGRGAEALPQRPGLPDPRREATWLLAQAWRRDETWVRLHPEAEVPAAVAATYHDWLGRRAAGVPAHHLVGQCPFWGREMMVSPSALVPRPETELVVEACLALELPHDAAVVDVGTGSGCLAVTLAAERPAWRVIAVDLSLKALAVARHNVMRHQVRVVSWAGDLIGATAAPVDLAVANLPYMATADLGSLPAEVGHDPVVALDGGADGLREVRRLLVDVGRVVVPGGFVVLELGEDQAEPVVAMAGPAGLVERDRVRDLGGCERVVVLRRE